MTLRATILIVDDEESIRFTFESFLKQEGCKVLIAENFEKAIEIISVSDLDLIFSFSDDFDGKVESLFSKVSGKVRTTDRWTAYLRLTENYFESGTLMSLLRKILTEGKTSKLVKQKVNEVR